MLYLWIALGSALGGVARYALGLWIVARAGAGFPWGTLLINVAGSFAIGFFAALTAPGGRLPAGFAVRAFFMIGVCGGFTTFSAFSLQTLELAQQGAWARAGGNVAASVGLCLAAVALGHAAALALKPR